MSTQEPAQARKRSRIEELRAAHQAQHGPFENGAKFEHGAEPAVVPGSAEHVAALFDVPLDVVLDPNRAQYLAISADEENRKVTQEMIETLDAYLENVSAALGVRVEVNTDPILFSPERVSDGVGGPLPLADGQEEVDDAEEPAQDPGLSKLWNRFTVDYRQYGADGAADRYKMEELVALARFNGVDTAKLRKKLDIVKAIFA